MNYMLNVPTTLCDGYKLDHRRQYVNTRGVYANMTARGSRLEGVDKTVVFGIQMYLLGTLIELWNKEFFTADIEDITEDFAQEMREYTLSDDAAKAIGVQHWRDLHRLGYLPLEIKALPEGTLCPTRVPMYTIKETHPDFYWLVNMIETDMSSEIWGMVTDATLANEYKNIFTKWAKKTGGDLDFVRFQGHNFSYRGCFGRIAAAMVSMAHCTSFAGDDTVHGRRYLKKFYGAKQTGFHDIISCSVFATEHAVMCTATGFYIRKNDLTWERYGDAEFEVFKHLITELYPTGIISIVSDTWDLWKVLIDYMVRLKDVIMARDGKVVIRPDSGEPVDIICGYEIPSYLGEGATSLDCYNHFANGRDGKGQKDNLHEFKGVVELLWDVFGGTINEKGYKVLDPHIGCIYGDSITLDRADKTCERLAAKKFCSTNWIAGIGSYTYQYVTRDTFKMAQKTTYAVIDVDGEDIGIEVFKDPITDDGTKKSARGLLMVYRDENDGVIKLKDQCTEEEEKQGLLRTVFKDSVLYNTTTLEEIRSLLNQQRNA